MPVELIEAEQVGDLCVWFHVGYTDEPLWGGRAVEIRCRSCSLAWRLPWALRADRRTVRYFCRHAASHARAARR